jgi:hypothetical protein
MTSHYFASTLSNSLRIHKLTPWIRVILEKLTVAQLVNKLCAFYGTRRLGAATGPYHKTDASSTQLHTLSYILPMSGSLNKVAETAKKLPG